MFSSAGANSVDNALNMAQSRVEAIQCEDVEIEGSIKVPASIMKHADDDISK